MIILGFVVWLLQRQIIEAKKQEVLYKKSVDDALKNHEKRLRDAELALENRMTHDDFEKALDRALKPVQDDIRQVRDLLNRILLGQASK